MSLMLASVMAAALNCTGVQSSALLWEEQPTQFQMMLKTDDFSGSQGPFVWELEGKKVSSATDGSQVLTATIKGHPQARFSAKLASEGESRSFDWQIMETTSQDGRSTLQAEGKAACKADNQVSGS